MRDSSPLQHDTLAGIRVGLFAEVSPTFVRISTALMECGARVEQMVPRSQWWLTNVSADVILVHMGREALLDKTEPGHREVRHLLQTLAQTERVIGLLDEPPVGTVFRLRDFALPPFRPEEVIPRIVRVLAEPRPSTYFRAGNLSLNLSSRTVIIGGEMIDLTFHEFEILHALLMATGTVLTRDDLRRRVWGAESSTLSRPMDIHIHRLRSKLVGIQGATIETVRNVGYRLTTSPPLPHG